MPFKIVRNDITKMQVDAVVNTANEAPTYGSGVDTAIYKAAGEEELLKLRKEIGYLDEGMVCITPGLKLPAKYIIHAVSPFYIDGSDPMLHATSADLPSQDPRHQFGRLPAPDRLPFLQRCQRLFQDNLPQFWL